MYLRFYRNEDNRWYIDLENWEGSIDELEMVSGADSLLDIISMNHFDSLDHALVKITNNEDLNKINYKLVLDKVLDSGATYIVHNDNLNPFEIWLCDVTKFVFNGDFPKIINFEI